MLLSKVRNPHMKNDVISVNTRSYKTDEAGCCSVRPVDVAILVDCGFEVIGQVETEQKQKTEVRMPQSKEEFFDMVLAIGLNAEDLRNMANLLDPPELKEEAPQPVTTYVAPPPPDQEKMITVPPDEPKPEEPKAEPEPEKIKVAPSEEPEPPKGNGESDEEVTIHMGLSKKQLLDLGTAMGLPVKQAMKKQQIYDRIVQSQEVDHEPEEIQQPTSVGPT